MTDTASLPSPPVYRLEPNMPNPCNPATRIVYALPVPSQVTLRIYDAAGRRVRTLFETAQPPRTYDVVWNGTDDAGRAVASGVYLCRLEARALTGGVPAFTGVRKMVLLP